MSRWSRPSALHWRRGTALDSQEQARRVVGTLIDVLDREL